MIKSPPHSIFMDICAFCWHVTFWSWPLAIHRTSQEHPRAGSKWCHASRRPPTPQKLGSFIITIAQGQSIGKHGYYGSSWGLAVALWQANYPARRVGRCLPGGSYIFKDSVHTSFVFINAGIICMNVGVIWRNSVFLLFLNMSCIGEIVW